MQKLGKHPNIVQYDSHFVEGGRLNILMEYCDMGNLKDFIDRFGKFTTFSPTQKVLDHRIARHVTRCLLHGLNHLSQHRVMHRDIKLENVMVKTKESAAVDSASARKVSLTDLEFKIVDFGTAKYF